MKTLSGYSYIEIRTPDHERLLTTFEEIGISEQRLDNAMAGCACNDCFIARNTVTDVVRKLRLAPPAGNC